MPRPDELLIDVPELTRALAADDPPTLLDVRWRLAGPPGRDDYDAAHVPGAVFVDLDTELCGRPGAGGRHPLPDPAALQRALRAAGVREDHPVVVYDGGDGLSAARAWWTLRWAGHRRVRVLAGGFPAWQAAGQPASSQPPSPPPGDFTARPGALPVLDAGEAAALAAGEGVLLDVRVGERFRGETEPIDPVAGHIPGALNRFVGENLAAGGVFKPAAQLRAEWQALLEGVPAEGVVHSCGSGVAACHNLLAMEVAGLSGSRLYPGSWSEWCADPGRRVATGAAP